MKRKSFRDTGSNGLPLSDADSIQGSTGQAGTTQPVVAPSARQVDLARLFAMRDLGMSGVVGGRRAETLPLDGEIRVSGSTAQTGMATASPRTVALSDGTRITFSNAAT